MSVGKHSLIMYTIINFRSERWLFRLGTVRSLLKDLWGWRTDAYENVYQSTTYQWRRGLQRAGTRQFYQGMQHSGVSR